MFFLPTSLGGWCGGRGSCCALLLIRLLVSMRQSSRWQGLCFSITCVNATVVALASVCLSIVYVYATSVALGVLVCLAVRVFLKRHVHR